MCGVSTPYLCVIEGLGLIVNGKSNSNVGLFQILFTTASMFSHLLSVRTRVCVCVYECINAYLCVRVYIFIQQIIKIKTDMQIRKRIDRQANRLRINHITERNRKKLKKNIRKGERRSSSQVSYQFLFESCSRNFRHLRRRCRGVLRYLAGISCPGIPLRIIIISLCLEF